MSKKASRSNPKNGLRGYRVRQMVGAETYDRAIHDVQEQRSRTLQKIDEIEAQMSLQWYRTKHAADSPTQQSAAQTKKRFRLRTVSYASISAGRARRRPDLKGLIRFADIWPLGLRKRLKALAGDYDADIRELHKRHRYNMAKWNKALAWMHAWWYVIKGPVDAVAGWAVKAIRWL